MITINETGSRRHEYKPVDRIYMYIDHTLCVIKQYYMHNKKWCSFV